MRLMPSLAGLFVYIVMSPAAQRTNPALGTHCFRDRMPVYRPDLSRVERMPILRPDTLKVEKMPVVRAFCMTDLRLTANDTDRAERADQVLANLRDLSQPLARALVRR